MIPNIVLIIAILAIVVLITGLLMWAIADMDTGYLSGFIREGQGTFVMKGESVKHPLISASGYTCKHISETIVLYDKDGKETGATRAVSRYKIVETGSKEKATYYSGFLGFLESQGIFFFGIPPFQSRMDKEFRWNEWAQAKNKDGSLAKDSDGNAILELWQRTDPTTFFYVQAFSYAVFVEGAETGGVKKPPKAGGTVEENMDNDPGEGGNISINLKISIPIRIIYPETAIFGSEDWFQILEGIVIKCVREYVGRHTFEEIRSNQNIDMELLEKISKELVQVENTEGGETAYCRIIDAIGVRITNFQILAIELSGESKRLAAATTAIYEAQKRADAMRKITDATAYDIEQQGAAKAGALTARILAVKEHGEVGIFVADRDALEKAGQSGSTIVFSDSRAANDKALTGQLILNQSIRQAKKEEVKRGPNTTD